MVVRPDQWWVYCERLGIREASGIWGWAVAFCRPCSWAFAFCSREAMCLAAFCRIIRPLLCWELTA